MSELLDKAKLGTVVPILREVPEQVDPLEFFAKLSNNGKKKHAIYVEQDNYIVASAAPCLVVSGSADQFEIQALSDAGKEFVKAIKKDLTFCDKATYKKDTIQGLFNIKPKFQSEDQRLKQKTHLDILKAIGAKFKAVDSPINPYAGLFGLVTDDYFADLTGEKAAFKDPDYLFYYLDNFFLQDKDSGKTYLVASVFVTHNKKEKLLQQAEKVLAGYEKALALKLAKQAKQKKVAFVTEIETDDEEIEALARSVKMLIADGYLVAGRPAITASCSNNAEPLDVFSKNRITDEFNFYLQEEQGTIMAFGSRTALRINHEGKIDLSLYTTSYPRGIVKNQLDMDLDNKFELLIHANETKLINHTAFIDSIRNDLARISEPGSKHLTDLFTIEKDEDHHKLVSRFTAQLRKDVGELQSLNALCPIGKLFPKSAMGRVNSLEKSRKGLFSSSFVMYLPSNDLQLNSFETFRIKKDKAYCVASASISSTSAESAVVDTFNGKLASKLHRFQSVGDYK